MRHTAGDALMAKLLLCSVFLDVDIVGDKHPWFNCTI
jgi:hypothetical protein